MTAQLSITLSGHFLSHIYHSPSGNKNNLLIPEFFNEQKIVLYAFEINYIHF